MPRLLLETAKNVIILGVEFYFVLVQIVKEIIRAQHLGNLDQLIRVTVTVEERFLAEDHRGKHGAKAPHVQAIVVLLEIDEEFRALEVARRDAHIILGARMIELSQAPVNETQLCQSVNGRRPAERARGPSHTFLFS